MIGMIVTIVPIKKVVAIAVAPHRLIETGLAGIGEEMRVAVDREIHVDIESTGIGLTGMEITKTEITGVDGVTMVVIGQGKEKETENLGVGGEKVIATEDAEAVADQQLTDGQPIQIPAAVPHAVTEARSLTVTGVVMHPLLAHDHQIHTGPGNNGHNVMKIRDPPAGRHIQLLAGQPQKLNIIQILRNSKGMKGRNQTLSRI